MAGTTVVVGGRVADNVQTDMPGGVIRGFDVMTGAMRWAFDPGNVAAFWRCTRSFDRCHSSGKAASSLNTHHRQTYPHRGTRNAER